MDLKNFTNLDIYTSELGNNMIHIHFPAEHLSVDQYNYIERALINTTKWNMSDPVRRPRACGIVSNDILRNA